MAKNSARAIREGILSRRLEQQQAGTKRAVPVCGTKTPLMEALEKIHGINIEEFIWEHSIIECSQLLDISEFTVGYWRKKFPNGKHSGKRYLSKDG